MRCTLERIRVRPDAPPQPEARRGRRRRRRGRAGDRRLVQPGVAGDKLAPGTELLLHGSRELSGAGFRVGAHRGRGGAGLHTVGLVPEYRASEDVPSYRLRALVDNVLPRARFLPDPLPARFATRRACRSAPTPSRPRIARATGRRRMPRTAGSPSRSSSPSSSASATAAVRSRSGPARPRSAEAGELIDRYYGVLPFELTPDQSSAVEEIERDLAEPRPMQRLLQGDVGSGKTVVALYALLRAVENGHQGALMAPTETLAEQHFLTVEGICDDLGVRCELLTSSVPRAQRARGPRPARERRDRHRGRHARAHPGGGRVPLARRRGRGRAAPLRRRAAARARPDDAARPAHDRDADPAHARPDGLRRPRRDGDRAPAARTASRSSPPGSATSAAARPTRACGAIWRRAGRPTSSARSSPSRRRSRPARPSRRPSACAPPSCAGFRVGCLHGKLQDGRAARGDGRVQARASWTSSSPRP